MRYPAFEKFINSLRISRNEFARLCKLQPSTIQRLYMGERTALRRLTALKIVDAAAGKLKLSDFGIDE